MSLPNAYAPASSTALPLHVLTHAQFAGWRAQQSPALQGWLDAQGFVAAPGTLALLPGTEGIAGAVIGIGDPQDVYAYAHAPHGLPVGDWQLATPLDQAARAALQAADADVMVVAAYGLILPQWVLDLTARG